MRRIPPAIGPVLALVAMTAPVTPAHAVVPHDAESSAHVTHARATTSSSRARIGLDTASLGTSFVHVSWNWIKAASGYRVQVSKTKDFSAVVTTQKKRNSSRRPTGGREATTVGHLRDASRYWVRVRKVKHGHVSRWSSPARVATKAHVPDKITAGRGTVGSAPGETRLQWKSGGRHTDFYRITTALTPFGTSKTPAVGRHSMTFKVPGDRRSVTLTPAQTAAAGAGLGSGRHLFFRIVAVRKGNADSASRRYPYLLHTPIAGMGSTGNGHQLRYAAYSMRVATKDVPGHRWSDRQLLIAKNIARVNPAVAGIEELMPAMWTKQMGGIGLEASLQKAGAGQYRITRETGYFKSAPQDTKILYDPNQVQLVSSCPEDQPSCYISLPDPDKPRVAAYARFKDKASGQEFYFISAHLSTGNDTKTDQLRGRQAEAINAGIRAINTGNLPVVIATDSNSSQTAKGADQPHQVWLNDGWYNTLSAATVVNGQYNSVNHYESPERPSNYGFGSMYDTIMTLNMPGADVWKQVITGAPWPSDHNMVYADVRLP